MSLSMSVIKYDDVRQRLLSSAKDEDISPFTAVDKYAFYEPFFTRTTRFSFFPFYRIFIIAMHCMQSYTIKTVHSAEAFGILLLVLNRIQYLRTSCIGHDMVLLFDWAKGLHVVDQGNKERINWILWLALVWHHIYIICCLIDAELSVFLCLLSLHVVWNIRISWLVHGLGPFFVILLLYK